MVADSELQQFADTICSNVDKVSSSFTQLQNVIDNRYLDTCGYWNSPQERSTYFVDSATTLRSSTASMCELVTNLATQVLEKHFSVTLERVCGAIKRLVGECFIIVEETVTQSVECMQGLRDSAFMFHNYTLFQKFHNEMRQMCFALASSDISSNNAAVFSYEIEPAVEVKQYEVTITAAPQTLNPSTPQKRRPAPGPPPNARGGFNGNPNPVSNSAPSTPNTTPNRARGGRGGSARGPRPGVPSPGSQPQTLATPPLSHIQSAPSLKVPPNSNPNQTHSLTPPATRPSRNEDRPLPTPGNQGAPAERPLPVPVPANQGAPAPPPSPPPMPNNNLPPRGGPNMRGAPNRARVAQGPQGGRGAPPGAGGSNRGAPNALGQSGPVPLTRAATVSGGDKPVVNLSSCVSNARKFALELYDVATSTPRDEANEALFGTVFAPIAKSLLMQTNQIQQLAPNNDASPLGLAYIQKAKSLFANTFSAEELQDLQKHRDEFFQAMDALQTSYLSGAFDTPKPERRPPPRRLSQGSSSSARVIKSQSAPDVPEAAAPPEEKSSNDRAKAVEEIFLSEDIYLKNLQRIIWIYKKPMLEMAKPDGLITEQEVHQIFSNVELIFNWNKGLTKELQKVKSNEKSLGTVFVENAPMMKLYCEYINNYEICSQVLQHCKTSRPAFKALLDEWNVTASVMDLTALLIQPVQRLPRYEMLIGAVVKHTPETHPEYNDLALAAQKIKAINDQVNESKRNAEKRDAVYQVQVRLMGQPPNFQLVAPHRELLLQGSVGRTVNPKSKKLQKRHVHVFNDMLLCSAPKGTPPSVQYRFQDFWFYQGLGVSKYINIPNSIKITNDEKNEKEYWVFESPEECKKWLLMLVDLICKQADKRDAAQ